MFSFRYHGNYVGPGWSAGRYQPSVASSKVKPVDEFDETARQHDRAYALGRNLKEADYKFFKDNIGKGVKRSIAALAVGLQGLYDPKQTKVLFQKICKLLNQRLEVDLDVDLVQCLLAVAVANEVDELQVLLVY